MHRDVEGLNPNSFKIYWCQKKVNCFNENSRSSKFGHFWSRPKKYTSPNANLKPHFVVFWVLLLHVGGDHSQQPQRPFHIGFTNPSASGSNGTTPMGLGLIIPYPSLTKAAIWELRKVHHNHLDPTPTRGQPRHCPLSTATNAPPLHPRCTAALLCSTAQRRGGPEL